MRFQRQKVGSKLTLVVIHTLMQISVVNTVVVSLNLLLPARYVRLREGTVANEGRVEVDVERNDMWQTVCDVDWDLIDADVVCKELGYHYAISAVSGAYFGQGMLSVWRGANCTGGESSITACQPAVGAFCLHSMDAGVVCSTSGTCRGLNRTTTVLVLTSQHFYNVYIMYVCVYYVYIPTYVRTLVPWIL